MTPRRAAGPGPRTVALHRDTGSVRRPALAALALVVAVLLTLILAACGSPTTGSPGPATAAPPNGSSAASATTAPGATPRWPGTTVLAVIALGGADGEIRKAGDDLQASAANKDLRAMWGAADGLAKLIDKLMPNIDRLEIYPDTQPVAKLYRVAFPEISAGAKQLRDAIDQGDANGVVAGSRAIAQGLADYAPIRQPIAALVEQAILQQRLLVQ